MTATARRRATDNRRRRRRRLCGHGGLLPADRRPVVGDASDDGEGESCSWPAFKEGAGGQAQRD